MIIDIIQDIYDGVKLSKSETMRDIAYWVDTLDPKLIADMYTALEKDDHKAFKRTCMDYMTKYGYEGSIAWKKFKATPIKSIKSVFNNKKEE